jgi:bifunctional non-homologous end joining protein LigD
MLHGKNVVVTGVIPGHSRATAEAALADLGANVQKSVSKTTDLLVTGSKVGASKTAKAAALGVTVVAWNDAVTGTTGTDDGPATPATPRAKARIFAPMLAQQADTPPTGIEWRHEMKFDGNRAIATIKDGAVTLLSRTGKTDYTADYPEAVAELATIGGDFVLDGELVVFDDEGMTSLQNSGIGSFVAFDLLELGDMDMRHKPLQVRRSTLEAVLAQHQYKRVALSPWFEDGLGLLEFMKKRGGEGIVSKNIWSSYREGHRGLEWQKIKVRLDDDFLVLGYTLGEGARQPTFGALLLGQIGKDGVLRYCGKVGTGFNDAKLVEISDLMGECGFAIAAPFSDVETGEKGATWIVPTLTAKVAFQRWTKDGRLWHPAFLGLVEATS